MEMVTITMSVAEAQKFFGAMPELYNIAQIAERYGLHPQFVREAIKAGRLNSRLVGKCHMCTPAEIRNWLITPYYGEEISDKAAAKAGV